MFNSAALKGAEDQLNQAETLLKKAKEPSSSTDIYAKWDGVVSQLYVQNGDVLEPDSNIKEIECTEGLKKEGTVEDITPADDSGEEDVPVLISVSMPNTDWSDLHQTDQIELYFSL